MAETSYPWGGTSVGDATLAPYSDDEWSDLWHYMMSYDRTVQGVIPSAHGSFNGNLDVTNPAGTTIRVAKGVAMVDGKVYLSTGNVDLATSGDGSYSVVLRKDFTAQTVRAAIRSSGVTQTEGTLWEIKLADVVVSGGVHTVTDQRRFIRGGDPRVAPVIKRQGGDANNWDSIVAVNNYDPVSPAIQCGAFVMEFTADVFVDVNLTFPVAFDWNPVFFCQCANLDPISSSGVGIIFESLILNNGGTVRGITSDGLAKTGSVFVNWVAYGTYRP